MFLLSWTQAPKLYLSVVAVSDLPLEHLSWPDIGLTLWPLLWRTSAEPPDLFLLFRKHISVFVFQDPLLWVFSFCSQFSCYHYLGDFPLYLPQKSFAFKRKSGFDFFWRGVIYDCAYDFLLALYAGITRGDACGLLLTVLRDLSWKCLETICLLSNLKLLFLLLELLLLLGERHTWQCSGLLALYSGIISGWFLVAEDQSWIGCN